MKKSTKTLVEQILSLDSIELDHALIAFSQAQEARIKAEEARRKKRPKQLPAADFNALIKEAKGLVKGRTVTSKQRIVVEVERESTIAWYGDCDERAETVECQVRAHSPDLGDYILDCISDEIYADDGPAEKKTAAKMSKDIKRLLTKISKLERKHNIDDGALLEAVQAKIADFVRW